MIFRSRLTFYFEFIKVLPGLGQKRYFSSNTTHVAVNTIYRLQRKIKTLELVTLANGSKLEIELTERDAISKWGREDKISICICNASK